MLLRYATTALFMGSFLGALSTPVPDDGDPLNIDACGLAGIDVDPDPQVTLDNPFTLAVQANDWTGPIKPLRPPTTDPSSPPLLYGDSKASLMLVNGSLISMPVESNNQKYFASFLASYGIALLWFQSTYDNVQKQKAAPFEAKPDIAKQYGLSVYDKPLKTSGNLVVRQLKKDGTSNGRKRDLIVLSHYCWIAATQSLDFERQFIKHEVDPKSSSQMLTSAIMVDPAPLGAALLIAAGHIASIRARPMTKKVAKGIYAIRGHVLRTINKTMQNHERAVSDLILVAILILAGHQALQASIESYHGHMRGLVQMINIRGGLAKLNETSPYLRELIMWHDVNVSTIVGCLPYRRLMIDRANDQVVEANSRMWLLKDV
ncbi:hypothetical protein M409DRAFT_57318 [Zasmidium cellare ATCC 36951]|uniref:Uncharacterized protein n=1 Tax=Zasmidium cellare ATCC 36951 TaxID=1080233 RepID=A0A6A6CB31_ZASCE|nr:uncharacterized protein M409DRAFT_57318 [Zasmidium cellare ATCC 36951]KAF2163410.1 hypothetical protein M409DRAFT_57318 [Zasmidium cellare ATCC 36951]